MKDHAPPENPSLYTRRSATGSFLFSRTDAAAPADSKARKSEAAPRRLSRKEALRRRFPDAPVGRAFIEAVAARIGAFRQFGMMAVRVGVSEALSGGASESPAPTAEASFQPLMAAAEAMAALAGRVEGTWGLMGAETLGLFLPRADAEACRILAERIRRRISCACAGVVIGIAVHPTGHFHQRQIVENAYKALHHALLLGPAATAVFDAVSLNVSGDRRYGAGDIDGAIAEYAAALRLDPTNVNVRNSLGVCHGVQGRFDRAFEIFREAVMLDPGEVMTRYNAGLVSLMMRDRQRALRYFTQAHELDGEVFEVCFEIGRLHLEMGRPDLAMPFLEKANRLRPGSAGAWRQTGDCRAAQGALAGAMSAYKRGLKINRQDSAILSAIGALLEQAGENPEIGHLFCRYSVELNPDNGLFRHRLARSFLRLNQSEAAVREFMEATERGHDSTDWIMRVQHRRSANAS